MSESLRAVIIQEMRARFPALTWKLGSLVRELVVEPLARLGDLLDTYIQEAESRLDIEAMCKNPLEHKDSIDMWMTKLGLTDTEGRQSRGSVIIMSETGENMSILQGTVFTWGDDNISLVADESSTWGSDGRPYIKYGEGSYAAEINVTTTDNNGCAVSPGVALNWVGAPNHVYDIYTGSVITGGRTERSYQEKATLILDALSTKSMSGEACISSALRRQFPDEVADVAVLQNTGAAKLGSVNICVKPLNPPEDVMLDTIVCGGVNDTYVIINATGIMWVRDVTDKYNTPCPIEKSEMQGDNYRLTINGVSPGDTVRVRCQGFSVIKRCSDWINDFVHGLPFKYNIITPKVDVISLHIPTTGVINTEARVALQAYINSKPLDSNITDSEVSSVLRDYGVTVTGGVIYNSSTINDAGSVSTVTTMGSTSGGLSTNVWAHGRAAAMYTYIDKINDNA